MAIIQVKGGLVQKSAMSSEAMQRMRQVVDANRQAVVHACFRRMEIPTEVWADAIEVRGIMVAGFDRPWDVTIGTLNSESAMHAVFGDDLRRTVTMRVEVEILLDVKKMESMTTVLEVEVGAAGQYQFFESIGKKGRLVLPPAAPTASSST